MNKLEKCLYTGGFVVLVLLFLLSSTDFFFQEKTVQVHSVSVIVEDTTDAFWVNYKRGMEQAATEFKIDISFVTIYDKDRNDSQVYQQLELVRRELDDGAQALVISAADSDGLAGELDQMAVNVPVIAVQNPLPSEKCVSSILPDDPALGQMLAERIVMEQSPEKTVYVLAEQMDQNGLAQRYGQLEKVLKARGFQVRLVLGKQGTAAGTLVERVIENRESCVLVGLDAASLLDAASVVEARYANYLAAVYGFGCNAQILSMLENGRISAIAVTDTYMMGYESIRCAAEYLESRTVPVSFNSGAYLVDRGNLYDENMGKIVFPIY